MKKSRNSCKFKLLYRMMSCLFLRSKMKQSRKETTRDSSNWFTGKAQLVLSKVRELLGYVLRGRCVSKRWRSRFTLWRRTLKPIVKPHEQLQWKRSRMFDDCCMWYSICYLLLIGESNYCLIDKSANSAIQKELADERSPVSCTSWISQPPEWLGIQTADVASDGDLDKLSRWASCNYAGLAIEQI